MQSRISRIELLEIKAEELRSKLDTVDGEELKALDEELSIIQDQIMQESINFQNEASYEDYLDYLGD